MKIKHVRIGWTEVAERQNGESVNVTMKSDLTRKKDSSLRQDVPDPILRKIIAMAQEALDAD